VKHRLGEDVGGTHRATKMINDQRGELDPIFEGEIRMPYHS
jgi:hypothetical protein